MTKVILDVDTGVDDAVAIILALNSPELEVVGITTVAGNVNVESATENTLKIVEFMGRNTPVFPGMTRPLWGKLVGAREIHGESGLGDAALPSLKLRPQGSHALDFILQSIEFWGRELTIVTTGPLTNVAMIILKEPQIALKVGRIISMGGYFGFTPYGKGTAIPFSEFNVFTDPLAADIVYHSGIEVTAVGLDVTMNPKAQLDKQRYEEIGQMKTKNALLFTSLLGRWLDKEGTISLHDPLAVSYAIFPSLLKTKRCAVEVELWGKLTRGQTVVLEDNTKKGISVAFDVNGGQFLDLIRERVLCKQ
jgi:inosine-uridine nucleoside N-ribohydrolase